MAEETLPAGAGSAPGDLVWNRRADARFHQIRNRCAVQRESIHGHRLVPNAESDWLVVREAHPPLVSRRLFAQATQRRQDHPSSLAQRGINPRCGRNWSGQRSRFILAGLLLWFWSQTVLPLVT